MKKLFFLLVLLFVSQASFSAVQGGTGAPQDIDTTNTMLDWLLSLMPFF